MGVVQRKSMRLNEYDYSSPGYYYVTFCTKDRIEWFGKVEKEQMIYNTYGETACQIWENIPFHYRNVDTDEYIVMPNHIHGVIVIREKNVGTEQCSVPTKTMNKRYGLLSKVVKSFKDVYKKTLRNQFHVDDFDWQRSFYDHIIRSEKSLYHIRRYIINNPLKWEVDKNNPKNWE